MDLRCLLGAAEATEGACVVGAIGAEGRRGGGAGEREPRVLVDRRPQCGDDASAGRGHAPQLSQRHHRVGGDHQRQAAHGCVEPPVRERQRVVEVRLHQRHAGAHRMRREPRAPLREAFEAGVDANDVCRAGLDERQGQSRAPAAGVEHRAGGRGGVDDLRDSEGRHVSKVRAPALKALPVFAGRPCPPRLQSAHPAGAGAP